MGDLDSADASSLFAGDEALVFEVAEGGDGAGDASCAEGAEDGVGAGEGGEAAFVEILQDVADADFDEVGGDFWGGVF